MTRRILPAAVMVLLLATLLRFHALEVQSFWNDEGNSARLSERPIPAIIEGTASDIHPPLYYLALHGWREVAGETEFGLRSLSALAGVLAVAVTMALARALSPGRAVPVVVAGLLAAVSPALVYYGQETRMYAMLALLAVASTWAWFNWLRAATGSGRTAAAGPWGWLIAYSLLTAAGLYTHYFFPSVLLAQGVLMGMIMIWPSLLRPGLGRSDWVRVTAQWSGAVLVALLLYSAWLPIFFRQIGGRDGARAELLDYLSESGRWLMLGQTVRPEQAVLPLAAGTLLVAVGIIVGRRRALVPALMAAVPLAFSFLAGTTDPAFFKFLLVIIPFLAILGGMAWYGRRWQAVVPALLTIVLLLGSARSLDNLYNDPAYARADYRGMAARIVAEDHPNAAIILNAPNQWEAFTYYYGDSAPVFPLPRGQATADLLEPELEQIAAGHDRLYALYWGEGQRDPQRVVERWLDANTFTATEEWVGDVRFVVYAVPPGDEPALLPVDAAFETPDGATITLLEAGLAPQEATAGDVAQISLVWQANQTPDQAYKVFVHLLDEDGVLVAQRDSEPAAGSRPTTGWLPGERVEDRHGLLLPTDLPPGRYEVVVGLYDPSDPASRLPLSDETVRVDAVSLGRVDIR